MHDMKHIAIPLAAQCTPAPPQARAGQSSTHHFQPSLLCTAVTGSAGAVAGRQLCRRPQTPCSTTGTCEAHKHGRRRETRTQSPGLYDFKVP